MVNYLVDHGIPADQIVADYAGFDTYGTCYRAKHIFGIDQAILVSQTYHLPRAVTTCRLLGVDATGVGDDTVKQSTHDLWVNYTLREIPANAKMMLDLVTGRKPVLGKYETSVDDALSK
jgi:vancomycin permeability regulator SanA